MYRVIGLNIEKFLNTHVYGGNCDFEYEDKTDDKFHIIVKDIDNDRYFDITLYESYGECGSGWCSASYGECQVTEVSPNTPFSHCPKFPIITNNLEIKQTKDCEGFYLEGDSKDEDLLITVVNNENEKFTLFEYSNFGGDVYYPSGFVKVNTSLFKELKRFQNKRFVYIFHGASGLGKTTIGNIIEKTKEKIIYETDQSENLPKNITEDIIIIGNRFNYKIEDVINNIYKKDECKIIKVGFEETETNKETKKI